MYIAPEAKIHIDSQSLWLGSAPALSSIQIPAYRVVIDGGKGVTTLLVKA